MAAVISRFDEDGFGQRDSEKSRPVLGSLEVIEDAIWSGLERVTGVSEGIKTSD